MMRNLPPISLAVCQLWLVTAHAAAQIVLTGAGATFPGADIPEMVCRLFRAASRCAF